LPSEEGVKSSGVRQILLGLVALVFTAIAVGSLVAPHKMAEGLGYSLDSVDALSEFRAIYVGLWLATAVLLVVALRRVQHAVLGDLCAILVLGQTFGRIVSLVLDGIPSGRIVPIFVLEAMGGVALLLVRPSDSGSTT
jgi:ABC-type thiamin/hydroxymethylpyrimidine transport system permease subunit